MPFPDLPDRLSDVRGRIAGAVARGGHGQSVTIVAVTKTHGADAVLAAWHAGLPDVGENRVQEALAKQVDVTLPVRWHLIGHLQRNKVRLLESFALVQSLDSERLAGEIDAFGRARGTPVDALVQVNVSGESTKGGYTPASLATTAEQLRVMTGVRIRGVMTMAPFDVPERVLRATFAGARETLTRLAEVGHPATELSMGMSNDYEIAIEEGATIVRLGTVLFGARPG